MRRQDRNDAVFSFSTNINLLNLDLAFGLHLIKNGPHIYGRWAMFDFVVTRARYGDAPIFKRLKVSAPDDLIQFDHSKARRLFTTLRDIEDQFPKTLMCAPGKVLRVGQTFGPELTCLCHLS